MAEHLYCGRNTITGHMARVKRMLESQGLVLDAQARRGHVLRGGEEVIRRAFAALMRERDSYIVGALASIHVNLTPALLSDMLVTALARADARLHEEEVHMGERHLIVAILRSAHGVHLEESVPALSVGLLKGIEALLEEVGNRFGISFSENEKYWLSSIMGGCGVDYHDHRLIDLAVGRALECIALRYGEDFVDPEGLRRALTQHVIGIYRRQLACISIENPLRDSIKNGYYVSYGYASFLCQELEKVLGVSYSEDEVAYIALHFEAASERREHERRFHVMVACNSGVATSSLVRMKLESRLPMLIIEDVLPGYLLDEAHLVGTDFVISTGPMEHEPPCRVVYVSPMLTDRDVEEILTLIRSDVDAEYIRDLFSPDLYWPDLDAETPDAVLEAMSERLVEMGRIDREMARRVRNRERESPTEIGSFLAIPHCLTERPSCVAVAILAQPILWRHEMVRIILFGCINPAEPQSKKIYTYLRKRFEGLEVLGNGVLSTFECFMERIDLG